MEGNGAKKVFWRLGYLLMLASAVYLWRFGLEALGFFGVGLVLGIFAVPSLIIPLFVFLPMSVGDCMHGKLRWLAVPTAVQTVVLWALAMALLFIDAGIKAWVLGNVSLQLGVAEGVVLALLPTILTRQGLDEIMEDYAKNMTAAYHRRQR